MPAKHKKIKLQLADQQTLLFVRKTTKDVDNENLGNTIKKIHCTCCRLGLKQANLTTV